MHLLCNESYSSANHDETISAVKVSFSSGKQLIAKCAPVSRERTRANCVARKYYSHSMASVLPSRHSSCIQFSVPSRIECRQVTPCRVSSASGAKAGTTSKTHLKLRALSFSFCPKGPADGLRKLNSTENARSETQYLAALNHGDRNRREGELRRLQNDTYLGALVSRYPIGEMPAWVFLEECSQHPISSSVSLGSEESHHHRSIKLPAAVLPLLNVSVDTKTTPQERLRVSFSC